MRFTCWINKATDTQSDYVILMAFHSKNDYAKGPQLYPIYALPLLFSSMLTQQLISL